MSTEMLEGPELKYLAECYSALSEVFPSKGI